MDRDDEMLKELKNIRTLLEPKPAPPPPPPPKGLMNEFKVFISQYKVLGMAVAFILGLYLGALVGSLVKDLIMPLIGLLLPGLGNLSTLTVTVWNQVFGVGSFIAALITFLIVALVIFIIVKYSKRMGIE